MLRNVANQSQQNPTSLNRNIVTYPPTLSVTKSHRTSFRNNLLGKILAALLSAWIIFTIYLWIRWDKMVQSKSSPSHSEPTSNGASVDPWSNLRSQLRSMSNYQPFVPTICISDYFDNSLLDKCNFVFSSSTESIPSRQVFYMPHMLSHLHDIYHYPERVPHVPIPLRKFADVLYLRPCHPTEKELRIVEKIKVKVVKSGFIFRELKQTKDCNSFGFVNCGSKCKLSKIILVFDQSSSNSRHNQIGLSVLAALEHGAVPANFGRNNVEHLVTEMLLSRKCFLDLSEFTSEDDFISRGIIHSLRNLTLLTEIQSELIFPNSIHAGLRANFWNEPKRFVNDFSFFPTGSSITYLKSNPHLSHFVDQHAPIRYCVENPTGSISVPATFGTFARAVFHLGSSPEQVNHCNKANMRFKWDVLDPPTSSLDDEDDDNAVVEYQHVIFTTSKVIPKEDVSKRLEYVIRENTEKSISRLPRTKFLFIDDSNPKVGKNKFGYPLLRDMFLQAHAIHPNANTYTYCNHDLIFNESFVETLDGIIRSAKLGLISDRFLVVGRRTNANWTKEMRLSDDTYKFDFGNVLRRGELFDTDAIDYFACSPNIWDWTQVPPVVIGRVGYDNWLLNKAMELYPNVTAVESSFTSPVIHQTTPSGGNFQGHKGKDPANVGYNADLVRGNWARGSMSFCRVLTRWDAYGKITVFHRSPYRTLAPAPAAP